MNKFHKNTVAAYTKLKFDENLHNDTKYYNIPKILFTYWDGNRISFMHYLCLYTTIKHHPDWKIILYMPETYTLAKTWHSSENKNIYDNIDYLNNILDLDIELRIVNFDELNIDKNLPEVIKSDIFRLLCIVKHGGIWFDMDILWINKFSLDSKINPIKKNTINSILQYSNINKDQSASENPECNFYILYGDKHFCQYLLIGSKDNSLHKYIYSSINKYLNTSQYQSIGTQMLNRIIPTFLAQEKNNGHNITNFLIDHNSISPFKWNQTSLLFNEYSNNLEEIIKNSYGIHWYNGHKDTISFIKTFFHNNLENLENTNIKNILYNEKYFTSLDRELFKNLKKVSIVMAYYNRKPQLLFTLKTISKSKYKNIEVIIIDDGSDEEHKIDDIVNKFDFVIKIKNIDKTTKTWLNPCIAYNMGIKMATGDIIIIQNPEVCHMGDCIQLILENIRLGQWLTFNCYGMGNYDHNNMLNKWYEDKNDNCFDNMYSFINNNKRIGGNSAVGNRSVQGWLNHHKLHFTAYHYLGAIYRRDLISKMNGGFCEEYQHGINLDDIDFIKYLINTGFEFVTTNFASDRPYVIHQFHDKPKQIITNSQEKHEINLQVFKKRMSAINTNTLFDPHSGFRMPVPTIV